MGDVVNGWLCPNHPDTPLFVEALITDVVTRLKPPAVFIDRIRFPEWGTRGLIDVCACFCDHCCAKARASGLDLEESRLELVTVLARLAENPKEVANAVLNGTASPLQGFRAAANHSAVAAWLIFRQRSIEQIVKVARAAADAGRSELWLDVWPPSYGWLLGQDLALLTKYATWTKPFTYHQVAGGANIAEFIALSATDLKVREQLYRAYLAFFGFPGPETFAEFSRRGLKPAFITSETMFAKHLLRGGSKLAAGLQLWQMGPDGVREALSHAAQARPDGIFFHCHGWATLDELEAAGTWLRENSFAS
jgi:hypothetical protein